MIVTPVEIPGKKGKGKAEKGRKDKGKEDKGKAKDGGKVSRVRSRTLAWLCCFIPKGRNAGL